MCRKHLNDPQTAVWGILAFCAKPDALLRSDLAGMRNNWAKDFVVNKPFNVTGDASKGPIQAGTLTYSSFTREIERVLIHANTVIVMGSETVVPKGTSPDAGKTIHRSFTNIWMKRNDKCLLTARHASVICPNRGMVCVFPIA